MQIPVQSGHPEISGQVGNHVLDFLQVLAVFCFAVSMSEDEYNRVGDGSYKIILLLLLLLRIPIVYDT